MTRDAIPITVAAFCFLLWLVLAVRIAVRQRARREGRGDFIFAVSAEQIREGDGANQWRRNNAN